MTVVVTGASGQLGRLVAKRLLERLAPEALILATRTPEALAHFAARGASVRFADFDRPDSLAAAFAGAERMLLISTARVGARVAQHEIAIDAAKAAGIRHVAYTSFLRRGGAGSGPVFDEHAATEALLVRSGLAYTLLRDGWYADAIATAIAPRALASGAWPTSAENGRCAPVARADCAACAAAVLTSPGHESAVYDLTGPELLTVADMARVAAEIGGAPVEVLQVGDEGMYAMFDALGVPRSPADDGAGGDIPWFSDHMVAFERAIREGDLDVLSHDVEMLLGRPARSLRSVIEDNAETLRAAAAAR